MCDRAGGWGKMRVAGQDPRLREFFGVTAMQGARFIVGPGNGWLTGEQGLLLDGAAMEEYSAAEDMVAYAGVGRNVGGG
ncbi:MAG: hypothetical protein HZY76_22735 [Anaerolineae bacterium]|nr:MAG: hypothetical protein HZY76_22735 [Anaerolineae bacterium]